MIRGICVIHEGFPGHYNQSLGIAERINDKVGCPIKEIQLSNTDKSNQFVRHRKQVQKLIASSDNDLKEWLNWSGNGEILKEIQKWIHDENLRPEEVLLLSMGSQISLFIYIIGKIVSSPTAIIGLSRYIDYRLYEYVIMPEDKLHTIYPQKVFQKNPEKVYALCGAATRMNKEFLTESKEKMLQNYPLKLGNCWGVLIGGHADSLQMHPEKMQKFFQNIRFEAETVGADIYACTSRRTPVEIEEKLVSIFKDSPNTRLLWLASEKAGNPVPGIVGLAERVYCTEDSVTMIFEVLAAKKNVILIPCEPAETPLKIFWRRLRKKIGALKNRPITKISRFRKKYDMLREKKWGQYICEPAIDFLEPDFDEASQIADWILANWKSDVQG